MQANHNSILIKGKAKTGYSKNGSMRICSGNRNWDIIEVNKRRLIQCHLGEFEREWKGNKRKLFFDKTSS
jgi:hypothetical protein